MQNRLRKLSFEAASGLFFFAPLGKRLQHKSAAVSRLSRCQITAQHLLFGRQHRAVHDIGGYLLCSSGRSLWKNDDCDNILALRKFFISLMPELNVSLG